MKQFRPDPATRRMTIVGRGLGDFAPFVSGGVFLAVAAEESWRRPGAVRTWCGTYRDDLRRLSRRGSQFARRYALAMLALLSAAHRACKAIEKELEDLLDREVYACEAAGESPEDPCEEVHTEFEDGDVADLSLVEAGTGLRWALR